ncbi:MAG: prepilin peptidase, partial [Alphaproteobacteria bacterium]
VLYHVLAGVAAFAAGFVLFTLNAMGGGDVKLMAAAAAWTGWGALGPFLLAAALAGGLVALVLVVARRVLPANRFAPDGALGRLLAPEQGVPYAIAIAAGGLAVMPRMPLLVPLLNIF